MRDRAEAITPTAAALVTAVARRDTAGIELILRDCGDLHALAVVLADNVGCVHDPRLLPRTDAVQLTRNPCVGCGRKTRSTIRLCKSCHDVHASPAVLDGEWIVGRDGIAVYVDQRVSA